MQGVFSKIIREAPEKINKNKKDSWENGFWIIFIYLLIIG